MVGPTLIPNLLHPCSLPPQRLEIQTLALLASFVARGGCVTQPILSLEKSTGGTSRRASVSLIKRDRELAWILLFFFLT